MKMQQIKALMILALIVPAVSGLAQQNGTVTFAYDANGNRVAQQIDAKGGSRHIEDGICMLPNHRGLQLQAVNLYPNPTKGRVNILIASNAVDNPIQMTVTTVSGSVILEKVVTTPLEVIDLSHQVAGMYFVKVVVDGEPHVSKITKE
mgnify:CR=1 FL=1